MPITILLWYSQFTVSYCQCDVGSNRCLYIWSRIQMDVRCHTFRVDCRTHATFERSNLLHQSFTQERWGRALRSFPSVFVVVLSEGLRASTEPCVMQTNFISSLRTVAWIVTILYCSFTKISAIFEPTEREGDVEEDADRVHYMEFVFALFLHSHENPMVGKISRPTKMTLYRSFDKK